jgi:hypothetical protein
MEPTIPEFEQEKTFRALDRTATVIGHWPDICNEIIRGMRFYSRISETRERMNLFIK